MRPLFQRLFFLLPLLVYTATVSHHIALPDSAIIIDAMREPVLNSSAVNHNLNNLVGHLFQHLPLANIALKANLVSVVYGTLAITLFFRLLLALGLAPATAGLCAGVLMVSHSMWWHSTLVENYALSAVFLLACLGLAVRAAAAERSTPPRRAVGALYGLAALALFNHAQNGTLSLAAGLFLLTILPRWRGHRLTLIAAAGAGYLLGLLPWLWVFLRDIHASGDPAAVTAQLVGGDFRQFMFQYHPGRALARLSQWIFLQFPSPFLLLLPAGLWPLLRRPLRPLAMFLATVLLVNTLFFLGYETWDQFAFLLLSFVCLAVLGALGADELIRRLTPRRRAGVWLLLALSCVLPPLLYLQIPRWSADPRGYWARRYHPTHAAYRQRYDLVGLYTDPIRHDRGTVEELIRLLGERLPPHARVIDDISLYYQIGYFQKYYGWRADVRLTLIQPLQMAGWGEELPGLVGLVLLSRERVFLTTTNGPAQPLVAALAAQGVRPVAFPLGADREVFELVKRP